MMPQRDRISCCRRWVRGGGLAGASTSTTLSSCTFSDNSAVGYGGLALFDHGAVATGGEIVNSTFSGNIARFARKSRRKDWQMRNSHGAQVGEKFDPFQRVGLYIPGGTAPLVLLPHLL